MKRDTKIILGVVIAIVIILGILAYFASDGHLSMQNENPSATSSAQNATGTTEGTSTAATSSVVEMETKTITREADQYSIKDDYPAGNLPGASVVSAAIEKQASDFASRAAQENTPGTGSGNKYEQVVKYETYQHDGDISFVVKTYEYTGGANGINVVSTFVFDQNGTQLALADVVGQSTADQNAFLANVQSALSAKDKTLGIFAGAVQKLTFKDLSNFSLTSDGVVVSFSQYDVAPGASGIVTVTIPYSKINANS
ncbi:MAG TPA: DUF3298 domain-containing protein [Candidatus Paceibacterota bacterium]|nr:DUF3298 domain-containing protein [Candidatus Paceibacterota bacterium]